MEFNRDFVRTQSGSLISVLTGKRFSAGEEQKLLDDNRRITEAANLRAQAAGEPPPSAAQIKSGEFGDTRSVGMRIADSAASSNPRSPHNPYSAALAVNMANQQACNFTNKALEEDAERLKVKEAEYERRRQTIANLPTTEPAPTPDPLRSAAGELRSAPTQYGEGNWRQAAADALDRRADLNDAKQREADAEEARLNDEQFKRTVLCATAQLDELTLRGDVPQEWVNEARQTLSDVQSGKCDPTIFWALHQPAHVERMESVMGKHKAEISRRQTEVDAYEQAAKEGTAPPPAANPPDALILESYRRQPTADDKPADPQPEGQQ